MLRLISYSSADSFIKRDYVLNVVDTDEKNNFKFLESHYQPLRYDHVNVKMSDKKTFFVQHRREYYNDFEDCLRTLPKSKQSRIHHSDGDNGESDSEYLDCTDLATGDLKNHSSLSSKSMPHVAGPIERRDHYEIDNRILSIITPERQAAAQQLSSKTKNLSLQIKNEMSQTSQLVAHDSVKSSNKNNNNNQPINRNVTDTRVCDKVNKAFVNEKSMTIDVCPTAKPTRLSSEDTKKLTAISIDISEIPAAVNKDDTKEKKRRSCKKRQGSIKDLSEKKMTVTSVADNHKINNLDDVSWSQEREVTLERIENKSFGISIVGGKVNVSGDALVSGIFIKSIIAGSSADKCGRLRVGDRILAVDGTDIRHSSHETAVKTIKNAGDRMTLRVQSLNTGNSEDNPIEFMKKLPPPVTPVKTPIPEIIQEGVIGEKELKEEMKDDLKPMQQPSPRSVTPLSAARMNASNGVTDQSEENLMVEISSMRSTGTTPVPDTESEGSSDDEEDTRDMEGKMHTAAGNEIDRASAGNVKRSKEEIAADPEQENEFGYTMNKIKKRYGNLGTVLCHTIDRGHNSNIGISLAGHRDRNKMACFIAGINPKGVASSGGLEIGDEILEVNGIVLHGRCHLNASAIIKGLPGTTMKFIVLRKKQALEDLAVKPVTQFPVEISNEDAFASFKNVRHVTIKKGNQSLGIMIIEGKHAEVGQGIFVSDIQEGSNAEMAGLSIGDMILAVNKDSLLGCNYETAASMLKKTEGIVVLTVCNPNKKDEIGAIIEQTADPKGPSRPVTPKPQPSPAKEAVADPYTCEIKPNHNTVIEIKLENNPIGIQVAGGCDTLVNTGAVIVNVLPNSIAEKDKRLQVFDQILDINSTKITQDLTCELIQRVVKQVQSKVKMTIYRADPSEVDTLDIELSKKPGKNLGLGFFTANPRGLLVTDIVPGGIADLDGRIQKSDIVTHVNSEKISNMSVDDCSALLKAIQGKVAFKILRAKPKKRNS